MRQIIQLPPFIKFSISLLGIFLLVNGLYYLQDILLPLIYATLIAILLSPIVNYLSRKGINRAVSILMVLLFVLAIIAALFIVVGSQVNLLKEAWPGLVDKFSSATKDSVNWISDYFQVSNQNIEAEIAQIKNELKSNSGAAIGITLSTMGGLLSTVFLTPVYVFMILYFQDHLLEFIHQIFGAGNGNQVTEVLSETKVIVQRYLVGLFAEMVIVGILNSIGLLFLGIDYAILLGILGAVLNVIPYLGGIIAMLIFMIIALITKSQIYVLYVVLLYTVIQLIDNNFLVPKIVGSIVKLNALVSLIVVIAGAALWGIPGMFLSIPITAILKVIFDRIDSLQPLGFILGSPASTQTENQIKQINK